MVKDKCPPKYVLLPGDSVFYKCRNPATGRIKRMAKDKSWADVEWDDGSGYRYTKRADIKNIVPLCRVLNQYLVQIGEL